MKKNILFSAGIAVLVATAGFSQTPQQQEQIIRNYDQVKLAQLEADLSQQFYDNQQEAFRLAAINGWQISIEIENGGQAHLVGVFPDGSPKYYATDNREGGITTRTDRVHTGGSAGLDLNGENMIAGIWDGGRVRATHNILIDRVTQLDNPTSISNHSTHVAGTMIGDGELLTGAVKGMAHMASLLANDFSADEPEMTAAAANGLLVSNHSYGIRAIDSPLWFIGYYDQNARSIDQIMYNAPYYLPVCSAGNDRQSGANNGDGGYDYLTDKSVAKNNIVVAAVNELLDYTQPSDVVMSSFSSWGPTDDGRIKPDISAKGVSMTSSSGASNSAYAVMSGTSMATPNVSGSLLLLQQHYNNINSEFMLASTLRAVALHTADEAGTTPGPDYRFGWGLLNTERAAQVITNNGQTSKIVEATINTGSAYTFTFQADGTNEVATTIAWTDPAGNLLPGGNEDVSTPSLVNDLDLRVSQDGGDTWMPWILDVANPTVGATTGDNLVDNIEKIEMGVVPAGEYIVRVSHKGSFLTNEEQAFSLIITGIADESFFVSTEDANITVCVSQDPISFDLDVDYDTGLESTVDFTITNIPAGVTATLAPTSLSANGVVTLTIDDISSLAVGEYPIEVTATGTIETIVTYLNLSIVDEIVVGEVELDNPNNNSQNRPVDGLDFDWEVTANATLGYILELALDEDFNTIVETVDTPDLTTNIAGLEFDTQYFWRVKGLNSCTEGEFSTVRNFTTEQLVGINENTIVGLVAYPNPAQDVLFIEAGVELSQVTIYSVLGQQVLNQEINQNKGSINMSGLMAGTYFVKVTTNNDSSVLQVVKK